MTDHSNEFAQQDFSRARSRAFISKIASIFKPSESELLPFDQARMLIKPDSEVYTGLTTVPLNRIVGSEGRYRDFNRHFLPNKEHLRQRWVNVDKTRYEDISLPAVKLYEMGGVYFVRDGNHRVSVARANGQLEIDAEVVSLQSKIRVDPDMSIEDLKAALIAYEKADFYDKTNYLAVTGIDDLDFTDLGCYDIIREHVNVHKYYLNESETSEIEFSAALLSWHENVFSPIILAIREEKLLQLFPHRMPADLYLYLVQYWDGLKHSQHKEVGVGDAARTFKKKIRHDAAPVKKPLIGIIKKRREDKFF
ncbi:MAG: transcriptional regulator [Spirochaetaceae bacterium]|nr:transcriptional regulator [Spirochaetaceae bacterium]